MSDHPLSFALARIAEKSGKNAQAVSLYARATQGGAHEAEAYYRLGNIAFHLGDLQEARVNIELALERDANRGPWHYRLGFILEREGNFVEAASAYAAALRIEPDNQMWRRRLARCESEIRVSRAKSADEEARDLRRRGVRWQEIEVMRAASDSFSSNPEWHARLGDALEAMDRFSEAASAFERANELRPGVAMNIFKEARCLSRAGMVERAERRYGDAVQADTTLNARRLGIGAFFQKVGDWGSAAEAYSNTCLFDPSDAELHFRAGMAHERCYRWHEAASFYESACALDPSKGSWHFRRGYIYERLGHWSQAAECYAFGLGFYSEGAGRYWYYRLGYVLDKGGDIEGSVAAYMKSFSSPGQGDGSRSEDEVHESYMEQLRDKRRRVALSSGSSELNLQVALEAEEFGLWDVAANHYQAAADTAKEHSSEIYFRLGTAHYHCGRLQEAVASFQKTRVVTQPRGIDPKRYANDKGLNALFDYEEMRENLPLRENVVLYESFMGAKIACNPYAIYRELHARSDFQGYLHVWTITSSTHIPVHMRGLHDVIFVERGSHQYRRYLATAKYVINNVTFESSFVRRDGQKYLNTWHGTPLKSLGRDIKSGFLEHKNVTRNFLQATHMLSGNSHTTRILTERYDVASLMSGTVAETGYPRVDRTLNFSPEDAKRVRKSLGLGTSQRKIVLYAPTWRGDLKSSHFDVEKLVADLEALGSLDCDVLFQAHHHTERLLPADLPVTVVPKTVETNDLLGVVDVLITDYSSILFDFLPTGRPAICYVYDLEEYSTERGLYFTPRELGLPEVEDIDSLRTAVRDGLETDPFGSDPLRVNDEFCKLEDGRATSRAIEYFFKDSPQDVVSVNNGRRHSILFHHSFLPNGITASLVNLISSLDPALYDITVVVPVAEIEKDPLRQAKLWELPESVHVVGQFGRQLVNIEEKWVVDYFNRFRHLESEEHWAHYRNAFRREFRRIFGDTRFDSVVEFEGYSRFWTSVLAQSPGSETRRLVYLHNDMFEEWRSKYHYLEGMFRLYSMFDAYVSVSPALAEENRTKLAGLFEVEPGRFAHAINQIDSSKVLALAEADLEADLVPWFTGERPTLLSMGRMSPEKDQRKLLAAVAVLRDRGIDTRLVIFGAGPLEAALRAEIVERDLTDHVYLAGQRSNPFPALSRCSCFVLASNHEGQPMVLLEALILGTPVVATDITGSRFVLEGTSGLLVENSVDGLVEGLVKSLAADGQNGSSPFNVDLYMKQASASFAEIAIR